MSRLLATAALLALAVANAACGVPYEAAEGGQANTCSGDSDCGAGAACDGSMCIATQVSLPGLELEVRPTSNAAYGADTSFLVALDGKVPLTASDANTVPFAPSFDVTLPLPIAIHGGQVQVNPAMVTEFMCPLVDGALPATVTFYPIAPFSGPNIAPVVATTTATSTGPNTFDADLLPASADDLFDVYVQPALVTGCNGGNAVPPVFMHRTTIAAPGALSLQLPVVTQFAGTIAGFAADDGSGATWTVDLVEPARGLPVSSQDALDCKAGVCTFSVLVASDGQTVPILRLTPPDTTEPTIYWNLLGTPLGVAADFSAQGLLVQPIQVAGQVTDTKGKNGVAAVLSFQSTSLSGTVQQNASRRIEGEPTAADGSFTVQLPPGSYQVRAFPLDGTLAVTDYMLTVSPSAVSTGMSGVMLPLQRKLVLQGTVVTPLGAGVGDAQVGVMPSQAAATSYWTSTHALDAAAGHAAQTTTDTDGHFRLLVDPGSADLAVTPDPATGFPWLLQPGLSAATAIPAESLSLQSPAVLQGVVRDPTGAPIADAVVNAWLPLANASGTPTGTAVQIAQTSTGADGSYILLLPPQVQ